MYFLVIFISIFLSILLIKKLFKSQNYLLAFWFIYLSIEILLGVIANLILSSIIGWRKIFSIDFLIVHIISTISLYLAYSSFSLNKKFKLRVNILTKINHTKINKLVLFFLIPFIIITLKILSVKDFGSSIDQRNDFLEILSGLDFMVFKFGLIILTLIAYKRKSIKLYDWIIVFFIFFSFSLYGGRFLVFSGILLFFLIYLHGRVNYKKLIQIKVIIPTLILYVSVSVFIANTRYYMSNNYNFNQTLKVDFYYQTAFMQFGGSWLDFTRVQEQNKNIDLGVSFFPTIIEGFLPSSIRNYFFEDYFKNKLAFGKFFAEQINEDDNALRLNFTNEIYFSFGYLGVILYSLILGRFFIYFENKLNSNSFPVAFFFLTQVMSTHILGSNTFSNFIILVFLITYIFNRKYLIN